MSKSRNEGINRREFLESASAAAIAYGGASAIAEPAPGVATAPAPGEKQGRPNILFINTDQQQVGALSAHGNPYVRTPNMDRLVARGTTFIQSYSSHPVCGPARACWFTGRPTSELGLYDNNCALRHEFPNLRLWMEDHGYAEMYIGKYGVFYEDIPGAYHYPVAGHWLGECSDDGISQAARAFLQNYTDSKPFFLSLGIHNPHDCCFWEMDYPDDIGTLPYPELADELPPLPDNFEFDPREPETFKKQHEYFMRKGWSETTWRYYEWSYYRQVEMADAEIGRVLDALDHSLYRDNTIILFAGDHGEGLGRHQTYSKHFLYDEAVRVPLVVSWPGHFREGAVDRTHFVSTLDFAPTVCDLAGVPPMPKMRGRSLRPLVEGESPEWRDHIICECLETGRMVRTRDFKYITYYGDPTEQLFDMRVDPGETHSLAFDPAYADVLARLKNLLAAYEDSLGKLEPIRI